jgi:hypothetical protein
MAKSGYLARQEAKRNADAHTFECVTRQLMLDTLQAAIHEEACGGYGYTRIKRLVDRWGELYNYFYDIFDLKHPECDVKREELDRILRDIIKDRQPFADFKMRYPEVKDITYEGRRKR